MTALPVNRFKKRLAGPGTQYGMWISLADPVAAEISAGAGFDWLMIDGEHSPNDLRTVLGQLQATEAYPVSVVVRPVEGRRALMKQYLDLGVRTLLIPAVESAEQAAQLVESVRYPPLGKRGVATARAARWGRVDGYWERADDEVCLLAQIETRDGLAAIEDIAAVDGVDGLFVGPSDLGADLGYLGQSSHPDVVAAVCGAIKRIVVAGKPAGVLGLTPELAGRYRDAGASFVAVGVDTAILARATDSLVERFINHESKLEETK